MQRMSDRSSSRGHAGRFDGVVWANDEARAAWDAAGDIPDGATFVEELVDRAARGDRPAGLLVMEKRSGAWRFAAMGPDGETVNDARVAPCAGCHRDAPRDFVFGPLRASAQKPEPR
jgi:hypothetical protein